MIESNGRFYVYSTGGGSKWSTDGLSWTQGPSLFPDGIPPSLTAVVSQNEGVWAPDVIYLSGQYYIYYALANTQNACAVGLMTTPTLDPSSPSYKLADRGVVVSNPGSATFCAIDPAPVLDASGNLWLAFGSGYTKPSTNESIYVLRLDNATGLPIPGQAAPGFPVQPGHIEASYLHYRSGSYYLFWNSGGCCSGAASTYEIHVARAQSITGPYSGSRIFLQSAGSMHGPGQIGIYDQCGASRFTYHYYPDAGGSVLGEKELSWGTDGWPVVGADSTTPLTPCGQPDGPGTGTGPLDASIADASGAADASQSPGADGAADDAAGGPAAGGDAAASGSSSREGGPTASEGTDSGSATSISENGAEGGHDVGEGVTRPSAGGCTITVSPGRRPASLALLMIASLCGAWRKRQLRIARA
jgi:beta-xylosidase